MCKKCKKAFRKDVSEFEEADEYCPHCDNHFIIEAKTPFTEGKMVLEFQNERGHENKMFKDEREKERKQVLDHAGFDDKDQAEADKLFEEEFGMDAY